jgi:Zn-dependent peptidase ImmA (M78 family)
LGHYVRCSAATEAYGRVDRRSDRSKSELDPELIYAEVFAACLLVPDLEARLLTELGIDDVEMALRFQVPREVVRIRLKDLDLRTVSDAVAK